MRIFNVLYILRRTEPNEPYDACRIHGVMSLNKVEGNFHITAGKSVPLLRGHAHLSGFMDEKEYNFTHRIDQFGFGKPHAGIVHPLAGDEKIASKSKPCLCLKDISESVFGFSKFFFVPKDDFNHFLRYFYRLYELSVFHPNCPNGHSNAYW